MSLITLTAFQNSSAIQMCAFITLGTLTTSDVDDDFLYQPSSWHYHRPMKQTQALSSVCSYAYAKSCCHCHIHCNISVHSFGSPLPCCSRVTCLFMSRLLSSWVWHWRIWNYEGCCWGHCYASLCDCLKRKMRASIDLGIHRVPMHWVTSLPKLPWYCSQHLKDCHINEAWLPVRE